MKIFPTKRIFLDFASATPLLPEAKKEMDKFETKRFFNPAAIYKEGVEARQALEAYRTQIAHALHAGSKDIIFTSGGTESDNLAIIGTFERAKENLPTGVRPHIIISELEHSAIVEGAKEIERRGGEVSIIRADEDGSVTPEQIINAMKETTVLISVSLGSSESGTIQPISRIGRSIVAYRKARASVYPYFHSDATAALLYLPINVDSLHVDLLTIDSAKIYGPKGIGALVVRPNVSLYPIIFGGGHERGLRSGTPSLPLIAGFAKAMEVAEKNREEESKRLHILRKQFMEGLGAFKGVRILGSEENSLPHIVAVSVDDELSEFLAIKLDQKGVLVSAGPACASQKNTNDEFALRFSFGLTTTERDVFYALEALSEIMLA